jgi:catechol 2,3-dioxygenase-like lactoylglutathione lyase family enzyme
MKRFHVHVSVDDLEANVRFYSTVFGAPPTVRKDDYAKWMMEDPRVNFAISRRGAKPGRDHLGVQVESDEELAVLRGQVERAEIAALDQTGRLLPRQVRQALDHRPAGHRWRRSTRSTPSRCSAKTTHTAQPPRPTGLLRACREACTMSSRGRRRRSCAADAPAMERRAFNVLFSAPATRRAA